MSIQRTKYSNRTLGFQIGPKSKLIIINCRKCSKKFEMGDEVVGQTGSKSQGKRHYFHKKCWEKLFQ